MTCGPIKFLLVDDLEENLFALKALLKRDGLAFDTASNGEDALELLLVEDYALALLDVQMPGMDGFELAEIMRGAERSKNIPIIFLTTGPADMTRRFRGYEAGAVDFIQKPIEADILRSKTAVFFDLFGQRRQIAAQRDALAALGASLQAADGQKNRFLAVLAHELRNPIMSLNAGLRLLQRRKGTPDADRISHAMERSLAHMTRLVNDLLDVTRIEQGKISLKRQPVNLVDLVPFAVETARHAMDEAGHAITLDLTAGPVMLNADEARLAQIISNLLVNAARCTPPGGDIRLVLRTEGSWAVIEVSDNGIGIPPDQQERIFDMFAQVELDGPVRQGMGIGLSLIKQLAELHDGRIRLVRSEVGKGSAFEVRLPLG